MSIPDYEARGSLPKGIHLCDEHQFLQKFCNTEYREDYKKCISGVIDFAKKTEATFLFFGGSFITSEKKPNDIDCVVVYRDSNNIPSRSERLSIEGTKLDIMFCSLENVELVDAYVLLLSHTRYGREIGVVQILLNDGDEVWNIGSVPPSLYDVVKDGYTCRNFIDSYEPKGVIVTIHGLLSNAKWNSEIAPVVSSQGWIFAPYIYENNTPDLLVNETKRNEVVDGFREWIYNLRKRFDTCEFSVIAHSFGTYVITSYLSRFEEPPVRLNCLILTGSIICSNFEWEAHKGKVARVLNEVAPNDEWVKYMPNNLMVKKLASVDRLFGDSGVKGFSKTSLILSQSENDIFNHNNVIKRDIIEQKWMPFLNSNRFAWRDSYDE